MQIITIENQETFNRFIKALNQSLHIALDTEFTRKSTYYANLSLIQIATCNDLVFIADYISFPELTLESLKLIYKSNAVKVIHSAANDLEIFYNLLKSLPKNVFDTQLAFKAINPINNISYAGLIKTLLDINIDKNETLSNWSKRPLTPQQLQYAALDVSVLYTAYPIIHNKLLKQDRYYLLKEFMLDLVNIDNYKFNLNKVTQKFVLGFNVTKNLNLLAAILQWREQLAKKHNIPRKYIIDDATIKQILKYRNTLHKVLSTSKFLTPIVWNSLQQQSLELQHIAENLTSVTKYPKHKLLDISYILLQTTSAELNINEDLICSKEALNIFLHIYTSSQQSSDNSPSHSEYYNKLTTSWRYDIFTSTLIDLLNGKKSLTIKNNNIVILP